MILVITIIQFWSLGHPIVTIQDCLSLSFLAQKNLYVTHGTDLTHRVQKVNQRKSKWMFKEFKEKIKKKDLLLAMLLRLTRCFHHNTKRKKRKKG